MRQLEGALGSWEDSLATWLDRFIESHPAWDRWLEAHLHAYGLHGPALRHLLKTRLVPAAAVLLAATIFLIVLFCVGYRRGRRSAPGRPPPTMLSQPAAGPSGRAR
jgi:hypothetical protein